MLPFLQSPEMGCDHGADGSSISRAVAVTSDILEDRADIQAGTTPDAAQCVTLLGIGEQFCAAVIQQNNMHLFRSIGFAGLTRTCVHCVVAGHLLARSGSGEHRQKEGKIFQSREHLLDAQQGNVDSG